jgi:hypothetical protein
MTLDLTAHLIPLFAALTALALIAAAAIAAASGAHAARRRAAPRDQKRAPARDAVVQLRPPRTRDQPPEAGAA